ncbi:hypothetical protein IWQ57_002311 [Coemansia nantahalensis]|uniref:Uncharacterized protein n=1 Tax=Coemansia nantahalensis TaxID=2789366 RepID=A0ACC1K134_9FUNG|nr:hypothetical protein IWQ57_002311 [Coemansia nantahalensis]
MSGSPGTAAAALTAVLAELGAQQQTLVARLQALRAELASGGAACDGDDEELLATLTHYVSQASLIRRRMVLLQGRVGDLKRRSLRLGEHRAQQSRQVAEWVSQERGRVVPMAPVAASLPPQAPTAPEQSHSQSPPLQAVAVRRNQLPLADAEPGCRPQSAPQPSGLAGWAPPGSPAAGGLGGLLSQPAAASSAASSSPTPSVASVPAAQPPEAAAPIAVVKRKGRRRVQQIE